ncbi:MAG: PH domain-containing protein [Akkermansia sp.]|nr:PH domain-containing protein [Akkermansia sp.]MBQ7023179.1 PH domain-containing protein [Akkermansia sp.]
MIDFQNGSFFKLSPVDPATLMPRVGPLLVEGENIIAAFKAIRDSVVFTNKRVISINVQGITGKKVDFTSLPYSKVQAYSVETAGTFDLDSELDLFFSGIGQVRFELKGNCDILGLSKLIASYVL